MASRVSGFDLFLLLLVATLVGAVFALVVGAQGRDGRAWWRSRFGVGWPTLAGLYCVLVVGLWLPVALGSTVPDRSNLAFFRGGLAFVGGCVPLARAAANVRPLLVLERTPTVRACDATPGRLAVEGTATAAGAAVDAPLSGTPAVAYRLTVDAVPADASDGERRRNCTTVANVECAREFALRDGTGAVRVDPSGAQLRMSSDCERTVDPGDDVPAVFAALLDREGVDRTGSTLLCEEATLAVGESAFVLGNASRRDAELVVDGGRERLVVPGSRRDALGRLRSVLRGGGAGAALALVGQAAMALTTGAL
jgi:hypothetical protein